MPQDLSREEFQELLLEFFHWSSTHPRLAHSWFSSLEEWASWRFNQEFEKVFGSPVKPIPEAFLKVSG